MSISSRVLFHHVICLKERKNNVNSVPLQAEPLSHPRVPGIQTGSSPKIRPRTDKGKSPGPKKVA